MAIRHSERSESRSSERRNAPPVAAHAARDRRDLRVQPAVGGAPVEPHERAAERRGGEQQRQPDPGDAERGAEDQQRRPPGSASSVTGSVDDEVGDGVARAGEAAVELERGDHERPSTATSPEPLSTWTTYGASSRAVDRRGRARSPDVLSASMS